MHSVCHGHLDREGDDLKLTQPQRRVLLEILDYTYPMRKPEFNARTVTALRRKGLVRKVREGHLIPTDEGLKHA